MSASRLCKVSTCCVLSKEKWVTGLPLTVALVGCPCTPSTRSVSSGGQEYPCVLVTMGGGGDIQCSERRGIKGREVERRELSVVVSSISHSTVDCSSTKFRPQRSSSGKKLLT